MLQMYKNRVEIQILKWVRHLKCVSVHGDIQQPQKIAGHIWRKDMNFKNTCLFAIHIMTVTIYIVYSAFNNVINFLIFVF
jgi:hypothetical protein